MLYKLFFTTRPVLNFDPGHGSEYIHHITLACIGNRVNRIAKIISYYIGVYTISTKYQL